MHQPSYLASQRFPAAQVFENEDYARFIYKIKLSRHWIPTIEIQSGSVGPAGEIP